MNKNEEVESVKLDKKDLENDISEDEVEEDYLVKTIGAFGLWQAVVYVMVTLTRAIAMWNVLSLSFLTPVIEFSCVQFSNNMTIEINKSTCYDNCLKYNYSSLIGRSIVEDFGLICQNAWLASFTQTVLMMGLLVGVYLFGWISDRFGRRAAMLSSTLLNAVFMVALPFSSTYIIFISIRFVIGIAAGGSLIICIVQFMEIIGKQYREIAGACTLIPDGLAQSSLAGFAYFTSDWRGYTLSYGVATWIIFFLLLFVPESPRWLVVNGKVDEAVTIITRAATRNKLDTSNIKAEVRKAMKEMKLQDHEAVKSSYLDFFKSKAIFLLTLKVFVIWMTLGMCFYGIYQYVTIVGVDPYLVVVIFGLVQIPIVPVSLAFNKRFGRKISTIATTGGIGIVMLIVIFVPNDYWLVTMLGALAYVFCNIAFTVVYVYVLELYPTPLRNMSIGLASSGAKIGAMIAPFIANLSPSWLPSVFFCILPIIGVLCCLSLPETKGQNLKDTVET